MHLESRGATGQPGMHGTAPITKNYPPPLLISAKVANPVVNHRSSPLGRVSRFVTIHPWRAALIGVCLSVTVSFMRAPAVVPVHVGSSTPGTTLLSFTGPDTRCWAVSFPLFLVKNILIFLWTKTSPFHLVLVGASTTVL